MAEQKGPGCLQPLQHKSDHKFIVPSKKIHDGDDVTFFLTSKAYSDIMSFIFQLNTAMFPRTIQSNGSGPHPFSTSVKCWTLKDPDVTFSPVIQSLAKLIEALGTIIEDAPPDTGPRRFGNISFRKWNDIVKERMSQLMDQYLPAEILALGTENGLVSAKTELEAYLLGSFGSSQRLDYGTGHELSFLAFLGCLWKLGAFPDSEDGEQERAIVLGVIEPYLELIRRLILTYTLEPAGSHGVWGLDDHSFLPYIFGSAQLSPAISSPLEITTEGSVANAPNPADVAKANVVERERKNNMYFNAIGFIYDVKKGPFWEHSPILYDISGVKAGWAKINKGMLKMYNAEVLGKFPVVQHFPFGSLFCWEKDPAAANIIASIHTSSQPQRTPVATPRQRPLRDPITGSSQASTQAPWASGSTMQPMGGTVAPWASSRVPAAAPQATVPSGPNQPTRAPWATTTALPPRAKPRETADSSGANPVTRAPVANKKP